MTSNGNGLNGNVTKVLYAVLTSIIVITLSWTANSLNILQKEVAVVNVHLKNLSGKIDNEVEHLKDKIKFLERQIEIKSSNRYTNLDAQRDLNVLNQKIEELKKRLEALMKKNRSGK